MVFLDLVDGEWWRTRVRLVVRRMMESIDTTIATVLILTVWRWHPIGTGAIHNRSHSFRTETRRTFDLFDGRTCQMVFLLPEASTWYTPKKYRPLTGGSFAEWKLIPFALYAFFCFWFFFSSLRSLLVLHWYWLHYGSPRTAAATSCLFKVLRFIYFSSSRFFSAHKNFFYLRRYCFAYVSAYFTCN